MATETLSAIEKAPAKISSPGQGAEPEELQRIPDVRHSKRLSDRLLFMLPPLLALAGLILAGIFEAWDHGPCYDPCRASSDIGDVFRVKFVYSAFIYGALFVLVSVMWELRDWKLGRHPAADEARVRKITELVLVMFPCFDAGSAALLEPVLLSFPNFAASSATLVQPVLLGYVYFGAGDAAMRAVRSRFG